MRQKKPIKLTEQIRRAIHESGFSRYRISQETGVDQSALSKFMLGQRGLSMDALDAIGECLQLSVVLGRKLEDVHGE